MSIESTIYTRDLTYMGRTLINKFPLRVDAAHRGNSRRIRLPGLAHGAQREQYKTSFMPFRSCRPRLCCWMQRLRSSRKSSAGRERKRERKKRRKVGYVPGIDVAAPGRRWIPIHRDVYRVVVVVGMMPVRAKDAPATTMTVTVTMTTRDAAILSRI